MYREIESTIAHRGGDGHGQHADTEILTIYDGTARKKNTLKVKLSDVFGGSGAAGQESGDGGGAVYGYTLRWVFSDLIVEFTPALWEVIIKIHISTLNICYDIIKYNIISYNIL
jgi:hypothetical protein